MAQTIFFIDCKTNLHVGSGKSNYGVIDNLVQRDPTFQHPVIHASSLKGGIKEHCHHMKPLDLDIKKVFGSEKNEKGKSNHDDSQVGEYKFFDAMLLCIPVRCSKRAFIHVTCPDILEYLHDSLLKNHPLRGDLLALKNIFDNTNEIKAYCFSANLDEATLEDFDITAKFDNSKTKLLTPALKTVFGLNHEMVILRNDLFMRLTNDLHLPVIARNYLENGESQNLWYEQVIPRLSRFWSRCIHPERDLLFDNVLFKDALVQIGANGSVGYGYCSFSKIS